MSTIHSYPTSITSLWTHIGSSPCETHRLSKRLLTTAQVTITAAQAGTVGGMATLPHTRMVAVMATMATRTRTVVAGGGYRTDLVATTIACRLVLGCRQNRCMRWTRLSRAVEAGAEAGAHRLLRHRMRRRTLVPRRAGESAITTWTSLQKATWSFNTEPMWHSSQSRTASVVKMTCL
jgi:hypothetical protein